MHQFQCDYIAGMLPEVLDAFVKTNTVEVPGYGEDRFCESAAEKIRAACEAPQARVFFLSGGTQTNLTVASAVLKPWQAMVAAQSGHVAVHETGAIEATGHKVMTLPAPDGKVRLEDFKNLVSDYRTNDEHYLLTEPGMLYVSHPTEMGTLYTLSELEALSRACRQNGIFFYLDGARLAYGLAAGDVTLKDIARLTDAFYIGGTKCGTLAGEALVVNDTELAKSFISAMRQRGALLAKGRLAGVAFDALFTDGLYEHVGKRAIEQAKLLKKAFREAHIDFAWDSPTNQIFVVLKHADQEALKENFRWEVCQKRIDGAVVARFCTAWSTTDKAIEDLLIALKNLRQ